MRIVWPLPPNAEANRIDAGFLDPNYPKWRRANGLSPDEHPGVDINLTGTSGDADLRYPVVAIAPMRIRHANRHRVWGNVVLGEVPAHLAGHLGYPHLEVQYAHLHDVLVKEGDLVYPGEVIGTVGKGDPARPFLAHLHFEIRVRPLPPDHWPRTRENIIGNYIDPVLFLKKHVDYTRRHLFARATFLKDPSAKLYVVNMQDPTGIVFRGPGV